MDDPLIKSTKAGYKDLGSSKILPGLGILVYLVNGFLLHHIQAVIEVF